MKLFLITLLTLSSSVLFAQSSNYRIYKGQSTSLFVCYLTISDSTIEVEYFNEKGGHIFGHLPAKKLIPGDESYSSKPVYRSSDNTVLVYRKKKGFLIKNKHFGNMKVFKSGSSKAEIKLLRSRYQEFKRYNNH